MDYATLKQRLQDWPESDGSEYISAIDTIIPLAEQRISKELNCDAMRVQKQIALTAGQATAPKPSGVVAINWMRIGLGLPLEHRSLSYMLDFNPSGTLGMPRYYGNLDASTLFFARTPDTAAAAVGALAECEARITGLSLTTTTTWLSVNAFDLLFYACLIESGAFSKSTDDLKVYTDLYTQALKSTAGEIARVRSDATSTMR